MLNELQTLIFKKQELLKKENTFRNRRAIRKIDKQLEKTAKDYATDYSIAMYQRAYELCRSIIDANFK